MDCLFCKIGKGELPANIIYEDKEILAFDDIDPKAPQHKIIIPRKHIDTLNALENEDPALAGQLIHTAAALAKKLQLADQGYRLVMNCNALGGQTVFHIHLHLLAGRQMTWPPG